jgi:hypothetical protein
MLRITNIHHDSGSLMLRLEGKLLEPLLGELHRACQSMAIAPNALTLDLAGLTYVDVVSSAALRDLRRRGIKLTGCSPLITELLKESQS